MVAQTTRAAPAQTTAASGITAEQVRGKELCPFCCDSMESVDQSMPVFSCSYSIKSYCASFHFVLSARFFFRLIRAAAGPPRVAIDYRQHAQDPVTAVTCTHSPCPMEESPSSWPVG